jgi:hypothetical protein
MDRDISEVKNWMHMFRWIVKLIRDDYGIGEDKLTRTADIENDLGLSIEQREEVLDTIAQSFGVAFPDGTLDELVKFEEMCLLAAWLHGLYKRPEFIGEAYAGAAAAINPRAQMGG